MHHCYSVKRCHRPTRLNGRSIFTSSTNQVARRRPTCHPKAPSKSKGSSKMQKIFANLIAIACLLTSQHAFAGFNCIVKITGVYVYMDGSVMVNHTGRNDLTQVCNINTDWRTVSTSTCIMWTSMLNSLKRTNGNATFYFDGVAACSTLPTYGNAPAPIYIAATP